MPLGMASCSFAQYDLAGHTDGTPTSPRNLPIESHAGHGEGAEMELSAASAAVVKAVAMDTRGKMLLERVEPILSNLEKFFANNPNLETL